VMYRITLLKSMSSLPLCSACEPKKLCEAALTGVIRL
jgi:hypothetical protein